MHNYKHLQKKNSLCGGLEFEELQGHVLVVHKALYGARSGGACWHDKLFDILHQIGFKPSKAAVVSFSIYATFSLHLHFAADCATAFWKLRSNCSASVGSQLSSRQASQTSKL